LNGWMILLPRAFGMRNVPALMSVQGGAVCIFGTWQMLQLKAEPGMLLKRALPALMSAWKVLWMSGSCGGALVARMNSVKVTMSFPVSSPQIFDGSSSHGLLSGTGSKAATDRPKEVFSIRIRKLVMPISLR